MEPALEWSKLNVQKTLPYIPPEIDDIANESIASVSDIINKFRFDSSIPFLSEDKARAWARFGSNLREGEKIEFHADPPEKRKEDQKPSAFFDVNLRHTILESLQRRIQNRQNIVGILSGNIADGHIFVDTVERGRLKFEVGQDYVLRQLDGKLQKRIQIEAEIITDRLGDLRSIGNVYFTTIIDDAMEVAYQQNLERAEYIKNLSDGWDDGHGVRIDTEIIGNLREILNRRRPINKICRIYPHNTGTIHLEFSSYSYDIIIEIFSGNKIEIYGYRSADGDEINRVYDCLNDDFWDLISDFLPTEEAQ